MHKKNFLNKFMNKLCAKKIPECPHLSDCSGCDESAQGVPPPIWEEMQSYFLKHNCSFCFFSQELTCWRLRAKLAVRQEKGEIKIGLFRRGSHRVVEMPLCPAHHPRINEALVWLKKEMKKFGISGYEENEKKGDVRYLQMTVERASGKVALVLVVNDEGLSSKMKEFASVLFEEKFLWHSIWVNFQPKATNTIFGPSWILLHGEEFTFEDILKEKIAFHPAAFFQAHLSLFEKMIESIRGHCDDVSSLAEFYAGVGLIGKCLKDKASKIYLVEANAYSQRSFLATLRKEEEKLFSYFSCDVDQKISLCSEVETIVVDPPRKGLSSSLLDAIAQKDLGQLIYLSCYFPSFKKDLERLLEKGWRLENVEGYLLFPGTNHVELLAFLKKHQS
jgi:23S rRNA (uracil1939-C5)-methyltransferase